MSPLPQVAGAVSRFSEKAQFLLGTKEVLDFEAAETFGANPFGGGGAGIGPFDDPGNLAGIFTGMLVPVPPQKVAIKPEGQRTWKWWALFSRKRLSVDDLILDRDLRRYRVKSVADWSKAGYYEYEMVEGPAT